MNEQIERITKMEEILDNSNALAQSLLQALSEFEENIPEYNRLISYYESKEWKNDLTNNRVIVKNAEVFEKVIPYFVSFSKRYDCEQIKEIFDSCRNKNNTFNFAAIGRIRTLVNIIYNEKNDRLDLPIKEFMHDVYNFSALGAAKKSDIVDFCNKFAEDYARKESKGDLLVYNSIMMMDKLNDKFYKLFRCLINVGKPQKKNGNKCSMERVELLWKERNAPYTSQNLNEHIFILTDLLGINNITVQNVDGTLDDIIE
jgi:hypothetical protein